MGYSLFKADKVETMLVAADGDDLYVKGRVSPSMKKVRYTTYVHVENGVPKDSHCDCKAGRGKCKHSIALLYKLVDYLMESRDSIPEQLACTSQPRQWRRLNSKPIRTDITTFSQLAPLTVAFDPDHPKRAERQCLKSQKQLDFCCLPSESADSLHSSRTESLTRGHPFWRKILQDANSSTSQVATFPLSAPAPAQPSSPSLPQTQ